jgi:hypothetical protein
MTPAVMGKNSNTENLDSNAVAAANPIQSPLGNVGNGSQMAKRQSKRINADRKYP